MRTFRLPENDLVEARNAAEHLLRNLNVVIATRNFGEFDDTAYRKDAEEDLARLGRAMGGAFVMGLPNTNATNSERSVRGLSAADRADMERDDRMNERAA